MGIFDRFKKSPPLQDRDLFSQHAKHIYPQIAQLAQILADTSLSCGKQFHDHLKAAYPDDSDEVPGFLVEISYEYLFMFSHLAIRFASSSLGHKKANTLRSLLGPFVCDQVGATWFTSMPSEVRNHIDHSFFEGMNRAEMAYAECSELIIEEAPFSNCAVVSSHAKIVAEILRCSSESDLMQIMTITLDAFNRMQLSQLISRVSEDL